jgi:hypothetical protein
MSSITTQGDQGFRRVVMLIVEVPVVVRSMSVALQFTAIPMA